MTVKKIFYDHPGCADGLGVVILSSIEEWLRITVLRTRIEEHLVRSFCFLHVGEKIDGCLRCASVFAAGKHQDKAFEFLKALCVDRVKGRTRKSSLSHSPLPGRSNLHLGIPGRPC